MFKKIKYFLLNSYHRPTAKILHIFVFFKSFFFNSKTNLFSEKMFLLKNPPDSIIYLNFFGRILSIFCNFFMIVVFNRFYSKETFIDAGIEKEENSLVFSGNDENFWPPQSLKFKEKTNIDNVSIEFFNAMEKNYNYSFELILKKIKVVDSEWWTKCRLEYQKEFLNENSLNKLAIENFRAKSKMSSAIISDLTYLETNYKRIDKIKALGLINLYHKLSEHTELEILRSASESFVGKNICLNYRNQRLSHTLLRHTYFCSQILRYTKLNRDKHNVIVDIGGGYGSLARLLKYLFKKSTLVIFEIPETCMLAAYFLKRNFPNANIGQALDFKEGSKFNEDQIKKFDFIILPQPKLKNFLIMLLIFV